MKYQTLVIKATLRQNLWFYGPYLFLLAVSSVFLLNSSKGAFVLFLQESGNSFLDYFFVFYTHVGDGLFGAMAVLLLLFINKKQAFTVGMGLILTGVLSQLLKHSIGAEAGRPAAYFADEIALLREIEYLTRHLNNSMPSGHSSAAFCLFSILALFSQKKSFGFVYFCLALLVGVSRMYLAQHFLEDVVAGSFLGCSIGYVAYFYGNKWFSKTGMEKPLINLG